MLLHVDVHIQVQTLNLSLNKCCYKNVSTVILVHVTEDTAILMYVTLDTTILMNVTVDTVILIHITVDTVVLVSGKTE